MSDEIEISESYRQLIDTNLRISKDIHAELRNGTLCQYLDKEYEDLGEIDFTVNINGEVIGLRLWVTLGGPTILIDTNRNAVCGTWGTDSNTTYLSKEACNAIDDWEQSLFNEVVLRK